MIRVPPSLLVLAVLGFGLAGEGQARSPRVQMLRRIVRVIHFDAFLRQFPRESLEQILLPLLPDLTRPPGSLRRSLPHISSLVGFYAEMAKRRIKNGCNLEPALHLLDDATGQRRKIWEKALRLFHLEAEEESASDNAADEEMTAPTSRISAEAITQD